MKKLRGRTKVHRDWFGLSAFRPGPRFLRDGGQLYLLDSVGSTSDFLRGRGEAAMGRRCTWDGWGWCADEARLLDPISEPGAGSVVVAHHQTAGHGRQGRIWRDCGGLHLSVVVPSHRAALERGFSVWLGLVTALVLRDDFHLDARLKWPNDIMVRDRKIGGILLQRSGAPGSRLVVAGLGLNLATVPDGFPAELQGSATSYAIETARSVQLGEISGCLIGRVEAELDRFEAESWDAYRPALSMLDCLLGCDVQLSGGGQVHRGRAVGIDDGGRLVLSLPDGTERIFHAGEVHLISAATAGPPGES